ncbi:MAG: hypothetical protein Q4C97_04545 [Bacillota bacterium]|nr:hypothetical protein [Bacillota bacterium]
MEQTKCSVCGGRIVNGRCQDCGMYYPSETGRYYLNEMREDEKPMPVSKGGKPNQQKQATEPLSEDKEEKGRVFWIFACIVVVILIVAYAISSGQKKSKEQVETMETFQWDGDEFLDVSEQAEKYEENQEIFAQLEDVLDEMEEEQGASGEENAVTEEIPVTEELMIAGEDFPAGIYDVVIKEGQGYVYYTDYSDEDRTEEVIYMDQEEVGALSRELGLNLLEGAEISMEAANEKECEIVLVPVG